MRFPIALKDEAALMSSQDESWCYAPGALLACEDPGDGAGALAAIAACPARSQELYRLLGLFCHMMRNKLNSLHLCLYMLDAEGEDWSEAIGHYRETMRVIDAIQAICRPVSLDLTELPFGLLVDDRSECWREMLGKRGLSLRLERPGKPVWCSFDPSRTSSALDDVVVWRAREAEPGTEVVVAWREEDGWIVVEWVESGSSKESDAGALPVAVLARLVGSMGGRVRVEQGPRFRLILRWPCRLDV
jgi:hypothetical protein